MADVSDMPFQPTLAGGPNLANPDVVHESTAGGIASQVGNSFMNTGGAQLVERGVDMGYAALHGGDAMVPYDKAVALMKQNNYDASGVPKAGWSESALTTEMMRQQRIQDARLSASRANLTSTTQFVSNLVGGLGDPITLAAGPVLGKTIGAVEAPLAGRVALGAGESSTLVGGEEALQNHLAGHDEDTMSWGTLRDLTLSAAPGALLHGAFGARPAPRVPMWSDNSFARAVQFTMGQEGGMANDTGGVTKFGISSKAHPGLDVTKLNPADAASIYHHEYWNGINGDSIKDPRLASVAFDAAVNQGVSNANKWISESGGDVNKFLALREAHYRDLATQDPAKYGKYLNGWLKRLDAFRSQFMGEREPTEFGTKLDEEFLRTPYSEEQSAVTRVMGDSAMAPAFSDEFLRHYGDEQMVLPKIEQRGPVSSNPDPLLQRFGQRMGADWEDRSNAARLAVAQLESDSPVDVKPVGDGWKNAFRIQDDHDAFMDRTHTEAMLGALPTRDKIITQAQPIPREIVENQPTQENAEIEHYKNAQAAAKERVAGLDPDAQEVFKQELAEQEAQPEFGTLKHEEVTKGVQAAIQCGVMKGVQYGAD